MNTNPITELDAVNIILRNDGEAPVATLDEAGFDEAADAQAVLEEISRTVQDDGWAFNVDEERKFTPNVDGEIVLPADTLWVRPVGASQTLNIVERARKLYNRSTNSYTFTTPVYLNVCQMLDYAELPSAARYYIAVRAARVYQARGTGSTTQNAFTEQDEARAQASLKKADARAKPRGWFRNPANARVLTRRPL
jgi:hypothetical protein